MHSEVGIMRAVKIEDKFLLYFILLTPNSVMFWATGSFDLQSCPDPVRRTSFSQHIELTNLEIQRQKCNILRDRKQSQEKKKKKRQLTMLPTSISE